MKIVAVMPIKLNNERLPGKNTKMLGKRPLLQHELTSLVNSQLFDDICVYCSQDSIKDFLIEGTRYIKRPASLDLPESNFSQIFERFMSVIDADIYAYAHATAPYVSVDTIKQCVEAVKSGKYDSAFCASRIQDFLWQDGKPLNFDAENIPRSQDIKPIYRETSGIYVFTKEVFQRYHRRVGARPFIKEVTYKEAIDINEPSDFTLAEMFIDIDRE